MKTIVVPKHEIGPAVNGHDQCYARSGNSGLCPGKELSDWLNSLGEDNERYGSQTSSRSVRLGLTNGEVRDNWLRDCDHIVARHPELARLTERRRTLLRELQAVRRAIKRCGEKT